MIDLEFQLQKERKIIKMHTVIKTVTIIMAILALFFVNYILSNEFISVKKYFGQSVMQTASNMRGRIINSLGELRLLSLKLSDYTEEYSEEEISGFLSKHVLDSDYYRLFFVYPDGRKIILQRNKQKVDIADISGLKKAMSKRTDLVSTSIDDSTTSGYVKNFAVPVYGKYNRIMGYIGAQIEAKAYLRILRFNSYEENGVSAVIDLDGNYIIKPLNADLKADNFFDNNIKFIAFNKNQIQNLIKNKKNGVFVYSEGMTKYIASFSYIISDSCILTVVPLHVLMLHIDKILACILVIVILISILLLFLTYYSNNLFKHSEQIIYDMGFIDDITEQGNKNKFRLAARDLLDKNSDDNYAVISIDITKFRAINELYGIEHGNKVLKDILNIINKNLSEGSFSVRDYAATYIILYKYTREESIVKEFIQNLMLDISKYCQEEMAQGTLGTDNSLKTAQLNLSFGIYIVNDKSMDIDAMCEKAYIAKRNVKDELIEVYKFYDDDLRAKLLNEKNIEDEMNTALKENQFSMYLQPKFSLLTNKLEGAEALVRWIHPQKGIILPINFIPIFEKNGFILEVDKYIWKQACIFLSERKKSAKNLFPISVNVSRLHLNNDSFISELHLLTQTYNIDPEYLELELTETACLDNEARFIEITKKLKELGFTIAIDDFGTGYSSLNMLRYLPVDVLKLDRGFIKDTIKNEKGQIIIRNIVNLANELKMITVAEGIETEEQAEFLKQNGCKIGQGYLYGKPVDTTEFVNSFLNTLQDDSVNK